MEARAESQRGGQGRQAVLGPQLWRSRGLTGGASGPEVPRQSRAWGVTKSKERVLHERREVRSGEKRAAQSCGLLWPPWGLLFASMKWEVFEEVQGVTRSDINFIRNSEWCGGYPQVPHHPLKELPSPCCSYQNSHSPSPIVPSLFPAEFSIPENCGSLEQRKPESTNLLSCVFSLAYTCSWHSALSHTQAQSLGSALKC